MQSQEEVATFFLRTLLTGTTSSGNHLKREGSVALLVYVSPLMDGIYRRRVSYSFRLRTTLVVCENVRFFGIILAVVPDGVVCQR